MATQKVAAKIESVLGSDRLKRWEILSPEEQRWLGRGIDHTAAHPAGTVTPESRDELAEIMTLASAEQWRLMPMGHGTKLGWGRSRLPVDLVVRCDSLNQVVERDAGDLTISVEAGMTLAALQRELASHNQFLPVDPSYPESATLGGIVATADSGGLRQGYGGVRDMLLGIEFVRHDGQRSRAGGKVVKNVAGYDLMKLFTGAYGTLGLISRLTWRVYPIPPCWQTLAITGDLDNLNALTRQVLNSPLTPVAWDWMITSPGLFPDAADKPWILGRFASVEASTAAQVKSVMDQGIAQNLTVQRFEGGGEKEIWQRVNRVIAPPVSPQNPPNADSVQIKCAVISTEVASLLPLMLKEIPGAIAQVRGGSGLGKIYIPGVHKPAVDTLINLRDFCQSHQGFLSVLDAPQELKKQIDPWGYLGQGKNMAIALRQKFDPHQLINPNCFIV
ncbi:MAG: FAD-binding oxidoreductase [Cyanobacteria bacterium P01_F01_bin.153]